MFKTAAHAIPKLYSLDPEMKEELIAIIERLLADRCTQDDIHVALKEK